MEVEIGYELRRLLLGRRGLVRGWVVETWLVSWVLNWSQIEED